MIPTQEGKSLLVVAGTGFLRAYSGTLYLIKALEHLGWDCEILVAATRAEEKEYFELGIGINRLPVEGCFAGLRRRFKVLRRILASRRVLITENTFLMEASFAKRFVKRRFKLVHFCQELHLAKDYPNIPRIQMLNKAATVPDLVIDVEPNRASSRKRHLSLDNEPWVLPNTLPTSEIPKQSKAGTLAQLAGSEFPSGSAIVLHMGGIGAEKPLERLIMMARRCSKPIFFLAFCNGSKEQVEALNSEASNHLPEGTFKICGPKKRSELLAAAWEADIGVIDYSPEVENTDNQRFCAPTKLYEFMALGLAILGSNNPSLRDIIEIGSFGKCAETGSPDSLADALESLLEDFAELEQMKERAKKAFLLTHSYDKSGDPIVQKLDQYLMTPN